MRIVVHTSMALVALAAAALSYQSLTQLGQVFGYAGLAWLHQITVDLGAAASCAAWLHTRARPPLAMTWSLVTISVLLKALPTFSLLPVPRRRGPWLLRSLPSLRQCSASRCTWRWDLEKESIMNWLKKRVLGDPRTVAAYREAQRVRSAHMPIVTPDETFWRLDMRVIELEKMVPYLRR